MSKIEKTPIHERVGWAARQGMAATAAIAAALDALRDASERLGDHPEAECLRTVRWESAEAELPSVHFAAGAKADTDGKLHGRTQRREPKETDEKAHRIEVGIARGMLREPAHAAAFCVFEALYATARGKGTAGECRKLALERWRILGVHAERPDSAAPRDLVRVPPGPETALYAALAAAQAALAEHMGEGRGFAGVSPKKRDVKGKGLRFWLRLPSGKLRFPAAAVPAFLRTALAEAQGGEVPVTLTMQVGSHVHAIDGAMLRDGEDEAERAAQAGEPTHGPVMTPTEGIIAPAVPAKAA